METSYNVRIWAVEVRKNSRGKVTSYRVRWRAGETPFRESFERKTQAESFRSELISAQRQGIAFSTTTGLPVTMARELAVMNWLQLACEYLDARWRDWSPNHRKHTARELMAVTVALLPETDQHEGLTLRKAIMHRLNRRTRETEAPAEVADALRWAERQCPNVARLNDPALTRRLLQALEINIDGSAASANTVRLRRRALQGAIQFAMEQKPPLLDRNPIDDVAVKKRRQSVRQVDPRAVVNPIQARMLVAAVEKAGTPGPPLVAFFGCMYYAAMRPEEVCALRKENLSLPETGTGTIFVEAARPEVGDEWSDNGVASEDRALKHREQGQGRTVPCPPELTALLHGHLERFGTAPDGRLFRGARDGGRVGSTVYGRAWAKARALVFTPEVAAGPLARRPYDLRHAAVSTWLTGGVEPTRVAEWAGHSLSVLMSIYAKCLDGGEKAARDRVEQILRGW